MKKKKIKHREPLSKLFDNGTYVCVKCRIPKIKGTVHCIVCNACCKDFDHHCFWLNRCISKRNLKLFKLFLILLFLFCIGNIYFSISNLISFFISDDNFKNNDETIECNLLHIKITKNTCDFIKNHKYFMFSNYSLFFIIFIFLGLGSLYTLIFQVIPVVKFIFFKKNKGLILNDFESSLIDQSQINSLYDVHNISSI